MNRYRQGYRAELALVRMLKQQEEFHTVIRSAGSRGSFDVVAIGEQHILLCQVKTGKGSFQQERRQLKKITVPSCARKEIRVYRKGRWTVLDIP